jgi:heme-degrading monooxygenase HmoA
MGVKILIERQVKKGKEDELLNILRELRSAALYRRGYISGETLQSDDDPSKYIVISNWQGIEHWEQWQNHPDRIEISTKMEPLLIGPEKYRVYHFVHL